MPTFGPRPLLDLPYDEYVGQTGLVGNGVGTFVSRVSNQLNQLQLLVRAGGWVCMNYEQGSLVRIPDPSGTTLASLITHSCGSTGSTIGVASLSATAGTTSTITTNQTIPRSLAGYKVFILEGPNAGSTLVIRRNTTGANSVLTVDTQASAFDATTRFKLMTPRFYFVNTSPSLALSCYDWATNSWLSLTTSGVTSAWGTGNNKAKIIATPSYLRNTPKVYSSGTATSGGASTLSNSAKAWGTNQWANYQIRLTAGTGAGQIRSISSNTATQITVGSAWAVQPDSTTQYSVEPNEDYLYGLGGNSGDVSLWRYSISSNTWTLLSPSVARGGYVRFSDWQVWMSDVVAAEWNDETQFKNGRYIYDGRTNSGATALDRYDIASNAWESVNFPLGNFASDSGNIDGISAIGFENRIYLALTASSSYFQMSLDVVLNENFPGFGNPPAGQTGFNGGNDRKFWLIEYTTTRQRLLYVYTINVQGSSGSDAGSVARRIIIR